MLAAFQASTGYATTGSICRAFLNQHPKKADAGIPGLNRPGQDNEQVLA